MTLGLSALVSPDCGARSARDAIELLVGVLSSGDVDLDREGFYSRLAEGAWGVGRG
jgi:hypothetical protein